MHLRLLREEKMAVVPSGCRHTADRRIRNRVTLSSVHPGPPRKAPRVRPAVCQFGLYSPRVRPGCTCGPRTDRALPAVCTPAAHVSLRSRQGRPSLVPKLSIIVPTRERSDTLFHTIRTLVSQDYGDCEFLVSDNASQDATRDVVSSFSDHRIRYINTGRRLSMSDNWEFALGAVRGEFVTYIGDDDGFIPGAVTKAMRLLEESQMSALAWDKIAYNLARL